MTVDEEYLGSEPLVGPKKPIWRSRSGLLSGGFIEPLMTLMLKKMLWIIYIRQISSQIYCRCHFERWSFLLKCKISFLVTSVCYKCLKTTFEETLCSSRPNIWRHHWLHVSLNNGILSHISAVKILMNSVILSHLGVGIMNILSTFEPRSVLISSFPSLAWSLWSIGRLNEQ